MVASRDTVQLRKYLRTATSAKHDALDATVEPGDLSVRETYVEFLSRQLIARRPVERWLSEHAADLPAPPATSRLIENDLEKLGADIPGTRHDFDPPAGADAIGLAWAIAGSQLGNRMMLKALRDRGADLPVAFLSDEAMTQYWKTLRPQIETGVSPEDAERAALGANAVFDHFLLAFGASAANRLAA